MNFEQGSYITVLTNIGPFMDAHPEFASLKDSTARKNADTVLARMQALAEDQNGGAQAAKVETTEQRALRLALTRYHMSGIAHAAKQTLAGSPDLSEFAMPKGHVSTQQLLTVAAGMTQAAKKHEAALIAGGLPQDFIAQLQTAMGAVQASLVDRAGNTVQRSGATAGLKDAQKQARAAINVLNTQVLKLIPPENNQLKAAWKAVKKLSVKPGLKRGALAAAAAADAANQNPATTPATTTPATPATPPTTP
jgi:hypothetical protein